MDALLAEFEGRPVRRGRPLNYGWLPSAYILGGMTAVSVVTFQMTRNLDVPAARRRTIWGLLASGWILSIVVAMTVLATGLTTDRIAVWAATNRVIALGVGLLVSRPLRTHARAHDYFGGSTMWNILPWGIIFVATMLLDSMIGSMLPVGGS